MSSHHIVRENQEPALLVGYFHALDSEYLGQILEWSPTIITDAYNLDFLLAEEIKVDIFVGDASLLPNQEQTKHIPIQRGFLEDALNYLVDNNYKAVNILLEEIPEVILAYADRINIVCFSLGKRFVLVKDFYEKWKPAGELIYIQEGAIKSFTGLNHQDENTFITTDDGFCRIEFNSDDFVFLGEDI